MAAPNTAEPDGAVIAARGDVAGLGTPSIGDGDLTDRAAGVFGVQHGLGLPPDTIAVPVELHRGDSLHRLPATLFPNPVIPLTCLDLAMVHQFTEDVDRDSGVGVPLCVGVLEGVREDPFLVKRQHLGRRLAVDFDGNGNKDVR